MSLTRSAPSDLTAAVVAAIPGHNRLGGRPSRPRPPVISQRAAAVAASLGVLLYQTHAVELTGIANGTKRHFGACKLNGQRLTFDLWFPHLGIALDMDPSEPRRRGDTDLLHVRPAAGIFPRPPQHSRRHHGAEVEHKWSWCTALGIAYVGPDDASDLEALKQLAAKRRGEPLHG